MDIFSWLFLFIITQHSNIVNIELYVPVYFLILLGWYCTCKAGARVVGCCAHIASVVWYLGWKRWQENPLIKTRGIEQYLEDAGDLQSDDCCEEWCRTNMHHTSYIVFKDSFITDLLQCVCVYWIISI